MTHSSDIVESVGESLQEGAKLLPVAGSVLGAGLIVKLVKDLPMKARSVQRNFRNQRNTLRMRWL